MITRLLVANRGEIARRVFATCRRLGIETVAVHSDPDARLPFVREADTAVRLPGCSPAETYLRVDLVLDAARKAGEEQGAQESSAHSGSLAASGSGARGGSNTSPHHNSVLPGWSVRSENQPRAES